MGFFVLSLPLPEIAKRGSEMKCQTESRTTKPSKTILKWDTPSLQSHLRSLSQRTQFSARIWKLRLKHFLRVAGISATFLISTLTLSQPLLHAEVGLASWYSTEACKFNQTKECLTASGKSLYALEKGKNYFGASWNFELGSSVRVTNLANGRSQIVKILDRGPSKRLRGRVIDLSRATFNRLSDTGRGLIRVKVEKVKL